MHHLTDRIIHTTVFVTLLTGTRNSSVDSPGGIDPMTHCKQELRALLQTTESQCGLVVLVFV